MISRLEKYIELAEKFNFSSLRELWEELNFIALDLNEELIQDYSIPLPYIDIYDELDDELNDELYWELQ